MARFLFLAAAGSCVATYSHGSCPLTHRTANVISRTAKLCNAVCLILSARTCQALKEEAHGEHSIQLLQHTRDRYGRQRAHDPSSFFNVSAILADSPEGTFLSRMSILVQAVGLTYNTTTPKFQPELADAHISSGSGTWFRKKQFDRDPDKGGVFARTFVNDERRSAVVAFKGICDTLGLEQCVIDACKLKSIGAYGNLSEAMASIVGADEQACEGYKEHLNYVEQALSYAEMVRAALEDYEIMMTGHSMGGLLAIVTASQMGLQALTFAPTPFHNVLKEELNLTDEQISRMDAKDLVATCDPFDCGINSAYVDDARRGSKTCLYMDTDEPSPCKSLPAPYESAGWREQLHTNGSGLASLVPAAQNLLCKMSAHQWPRYEAIVLEQGSDGAPSNLPVCNTDFSVLDVSDGMWQKLDFLRTWFGSYRPG
ncbi:unnamed protein product [Symbiodinium natans]|uniref:Fungal lipase-like domain-containing protein n=1 Tax=Symbiodinium natans TaxID=878477 RepID=A0A812SYN4_9DINO|nr:unnamed protein product [Symbiodinium natans]